MRAVLGTILGYVVIAVILTAMLFGAYFALGTERSFQPGSYEPSALWLAIMFAAGLVAAISGGFLARKIGKGEAVKGLIGVILVLGLGMAALEAMNKDEQPQERGSEVSGVDAMTHARTPLWAALANPVIGVVGVLIGAGKAGKKR